MMDYGSGHWFARFGDWACGPGAFFPGPLGWMISILFWILFIYLVVKFFQFIFSKDKEVVPSRLDILKERYARGDIDEDEYRRMKAELV
jgi:putative membrane protein